MCRKPKHTVVTVAYTFSAPDSGSYMLNLPMCVDHAAALKVRVQSDLSSPSLAERLDT